MKNLIKFHYDFIKIKVPNVEESKIKWHNFDEHPNLKRHYCLKPNDELRYYKNFDMYLNKSGDAIIRTSMPYLVKGHNHTSFDLDDVLICIGNLELLLGIDFSDSFVLEYEYGCFQTIKTSCKSYIDGIMGASGFKLLKSTNYMKLFNVGQGIKYKVYDAVANSKVKKTYSRGNYPKSNLIKHEIKIDFKCTKLQSLHIEHFLEDYMEKFNNDTLLQMVRQNQPLEDEDDRFINAKTLNDILFISLKEIEKLLGINTYQIVRKVINQLDLTASQKCKRVKSLEHLEHVYSVPKLQEITD